MTMRVRASQTRLTAVVVVMAVSVMIASATGTENPRVVTLCPKKSLTDSIFWFHAQKCVVFGCDFNSVESPDFTYVIEGDEVLLRKALREVNKNGYEYVAVIFYASWCPFSKDLRPKFSLVSALFPSIPHFAIEESSIRPGLLTRYYLVHGYPTLFLENSTMRIEYRGSRTLGSLVSFYSDVTGIRLASLDEQSLEKIAGLSNREKRYTNEQESRSFSWVRSPENMLKQETYLALASTFVLLRLLYFVSPALLVCARFVWRWDVPNMRSGSLFKGPCLYVIRVIQFVKAGLWQK